MDWFRFHTKTLESQKVQNLNPTMFKAWVNLLCVARLFDGKLPEYGEIAWRLRISEDEARSIVEELITAKLLDKKGNIIRPHDWEEHQKASDSSASRVKKHRDKKRECNVTPPLLLRDANALDQTRLDQSRAEQKSVTASPHETTAPMSVSEWSDDSIAQWCNTVQARHPKKSDTILGRQALCQCSWIQDPKQRAEFDRVHKLWCATDAWRDKQGQFAPVLWRWITQGDYKHEPPSANAPAAERKSISTVDPEVTRRLAERKKQNAEPGK